MSGGAGERWSPYPVQDWANLPYDPLAPDHTYVDPSWGAPRSLRRSERRPLLIMLVVLALVGAGMYLADARTEPRVTATGAYLPGDGAVSYVEQTTTQGMQTLRSSYVTESARLPGSAALLSLDQALTRQVFGVLGGTSPVGHQFWRTTTSEVNSLGSPQQVRLYRVDDAVELLAESGPGQARTYAPGLVELPADVRAGARWSGSGRSGSATYRSDFAATADTGDCLRVTGTVVFTAAGGGTTESRQQTRRWCRGSTPVLLEQRIGGLRVSEQPVVVPAAPATLATTTDPYPWSDPAGWRARTYDAMSIDPNLGEGMMQGVPSAAPPVVTASGLMVRASSTDDLVAFTPKTRTQWTSVWRMRPGGRILTLAAFGDVVVATTSLRQVVAYTDAGIRLWSRDLSELDYQAPVRLDASAAVLVDAAGQVSVVELTTGALRWREEIGTEVTASPVVGGDTVVVIDGGGTVHAFGADGVARWTAEIEATRGMALGDELVLHNASTLMALNLSDGRYRWLRPTLGTVADLQPYGNRVVLATRLGSTVFDADGREVATWPAYETLTVNGDHLIGWGATQAEVRAADLHLITTWDTPDQTNASSTIQALVGRQGVSRFTTGWTWIDFGDAP